MDKDPSLKQILAQMVKEALELNQSGDHGSANEVLDALLRRIELMKEDS